jgi:hypothetical protein
LATYLIRHADLKGVVFKEGAEAGHEIAHRSLSLMKRADGVGRLGGGVGKAMEQWVVEGWLYIVIMSVVIGIVIGYGSMYLIKFALRKKWIDSESLLLWPMAVGVSLTP